MSAAALTLAACAMPQHSNTMIFATNTALALDVSADPTTGSPNITVGYKRQEAAWVPLLANVGGPAGERTAAQCATPGQPTDNCVFRGTAGKDSDAYSVLGTFGAGYGATANAAKGTPQAQASGTIAQYFATGMAARLLAQTGGAQTVNTAASSPAGDALAATIVTNHEAHLKKIADFIGDDPNQFVANRDKLIAAANFDADDDAPSLVKSYTTREQLLTGLRDKPGLATKLAAGAS